MNFEEKKRKSSDHFRSIYGYTMGILWIVIGLFFLFQKRLGYDFELGKTATIIFGVSSLLYGGFRIYRGFKKGNL